MQSTMTAAVLHGPHDLRLERRPVPTPGSGDVLVRVHSVGVCGSDVHFWHDGRIGRTIVSSPLVLGHECAGIVDMVGADVTTLAPGDRVAIEPGVPCRRCRICLSGRYNLCPHVFFMATPPDDGAFTEYVAHPADFAFKLPAHVSLDEGAMIEPLSVGIHAARRAGISPGTRVLITGSGTIGLCALLAARAAGAATTIVSDVVPSRLAIARSLGADVAVDSREASVPDVVRAETAGAGADVVIECSGSAPAIADAMQSARRGATVVIVGLGRDVLEVPFSRLIGYELDIKGVHRYTNTYGPAVAMLASGQIDVKPLITHHFALDDVGQAMEVAHSDREHAIKVVVHPGPAGG